MASCSTIRARETCPVHIAKEHQNLCLFRTWYFGQIFHKQCTSISTSILFRQKYLDGYFSHLLPPLCPPLFLDRAPFLQTFHFYWWSTIFLSQEFTAIFIGVFFCHNALSWRWGRGFLCDKERIVYGSWIDESLLVISRFISYDRFKDLDKLVFEEFVFTWRVQKWIIIYTKEWKNWCYITESFKVMEF